MKAVLAALQTTEDDESFERSLEELAGLADACGVETADIVIQRAPHPVHATYIGSGKTDELKSVLYANDASLVIFDKSLSPIQVRNLGRILDCEVIDRTDLILRIFSERARTKEAMLQVEYARLDYMLPRLIGMRENLSRQGGASGFMSSRGAGETQLELDRRKILNRQAQLRKELKNVERVRDTQRESRLSSGLPRIGIVGYTNAGKSTLLNRLLSMSNEDRQVFAEDMLFATLDTTTRRIDIWGRRPFLISDTVGFISDLPTSLVDAFKSTLAEAAYADLLLEVVDSTDPAHDAQSAVTHDILNEIGAGTIPRIRVMNKAENSDRTGKIRKTGGMYDNPEIAISALTGEGIEELLDLAEELLYGKTAEYTFLIPYDRGDIVSGLTKTANVLSCEYTPEGTAMTVCMNSEIAKMYSVFCADK